MPGVLLNEAWWRWRARHGLAPGRLRPARAAWRLGLPPLAAAAAGRCLAWLLPNVAWLCARQPLLPLLLLLAVSARGGLAAARALRAAAQDHWLQALPWSPARRHFQQWALAGMQAFARALPLWLMLCVAAFCVAPQSMLALAPDAVGTAVIMLLAACGGSLLGMRRAHANLSPPTPVVTARVDSTGVVSLRRLLWRWQLRRLGQVRPDRHKLLLAALALAMPMGTPPGVALLLLASGWLLASALDALASSRATLLQALMLTQACITPPRRWLLAHLPLPLLVLVLSSLFGASAAWSLGLTTHWLPATTGLLVVSCCATLASTSWRVFRRRRFDPWR